jgi:hypothetical protein
VSSTLILFLTCASVSTACTLALLLLLFSLRGPAASAPVTVDAVAAGAAAADAPGLPRRPPPRQQNAATTPEWMQFQSATSKKPKQKSRSHVRQTPPEALQETFWKKTFVTPSRASGLERNAKRYKVTN